MLPAPATQAPAAADPRVTTLADLDRAQVDALLAAYGARLVDVAPGAAIPGSYWGESEAGLVANRVYARVDTPAHSLLHELCHYVCMDDARRARLATDAGGSDDEECGVCYLQVVLADELRGFGRAACMRDMNAWGYSFREGAAEAWLAGDARFARDWLSRRALIHSDGRPTFNLRGAERDSTSIER